jgi:uncharacterized protein
MGGERVQPQIKNLIGLVLAGTPNQVHEAPGAGGYLNAQEKEYGWTPLMYAAAKNLKPDVISALLTAGAGINSADYSGMIALMWAAQGNQNPEVITTLLKRGADVKAKNSAGKTAFNLAYHHKGTAVYHELQLRGLT